MVYINYMELLRRMTGDPWTRLVTVLAAGCVTLLTLAEQYAALPGGGGRVRGRAGRRRLRPPRQ